MSKGSQNFKKNITCKSLPMIKGGGSGDGSGPTSSSRTYPKGGGASMSANFLPSSGQRSSTRWVVGGRP